MYDCILVPTDGSDAAETAANGALRLASRFDADLHTLHVAPDDASADPPGESSLGDIATRAAERDVHATTDVRDADGSVSETIVDYAETVGADLLVMGTHGRTGLDRFALGSVTERTLRTSPAPVLTVRETTPLADDLEDVLVATDGSEGAQAAVDHAVTLAAATAATLHVMHVVDVTVAWPADSGGPILDAMEEAGRQALDRAVDRADRADVPAVEATLVSGSPARAIVDYAAEAGVDLTVVGTHGRTGVDRLLLGSVAERVVRTAGTPVLALKAADAEPAETDWTAIHEA